MGHPATRGNLAAASILNQNPSFEMASNFLSYLGGKDMKRLLACALCTRTSHAAVNAAADQTFHMAGFWHTPHGKYTRI